MTDRGLPIVDGAPACPFVAFDDDRESRATSPDHRHRCYAEVRPAPRALAHQEAYCLSSAFPVCPSFQDWARREAAQAKAAGAAAATAAAAASTRDRDDSDAASPVRGHGEPDGPSDGDRHGRPGSDDGFDDEEAPSRGYGSMERNPPRNWAAPPPWMNSDEEPEEEEEDVMPLPPVRGGGLAGSFADRLSGGAAARSGTAPAARWDEDRPTPSESAPEASGHAGRPAPGPAAGPTHHDDAPAPAQRERRPARDARTAPPALPGPSWERPRRLEAYPTLKTRMGLGSITLPPVLVAVGAVVIAAVVLFFLPALLGVGNQPGAASPSPTAGSSSGVTAPPGTPTPVPGPTQQVYVVQAGDTMSKIANRFGVPLDALIEANRENIPNPDLLDLGQEVFIPGTAPTSLPDAGASTSP